MPVNSKTATTVVTIPFNLTERNISEYKESLRRLINSRPEFIAVDCSSLEQVISRHVNLLWETRILCVNAGLNMKLTSITPGLKRILELLDIYDILNEEPESKIQSERKYTMPPQRKLVHETRDEIDQFLNNMGVPSLVVFEVKTMFYEIATNICLYAQLPVDAEISIHINCTENNLSMIITDSGIPFDPTAADISYNPDISIKNAQKRGFGLVMINKMADKITYNRENGIHNVLTIEKRWKLYE